MKKVLVYILLIIYASGFSQKKVKAEIDTTSIRIGEQFQYKILVDETENVIIPKLELNGLEVVDSTKIDTVKNKLIKKYILTGFDSGAYYIPQQQIFIKNQAHLTDSLLINVKTVAVDTTKIKKFPIKGIKSEPYKLNDFSHLWWVALLVLVLVASLVYLMFFKKRKKEVLKPQKPKLPPYKQAIESLKKLDEKLLWQNNKIKKYYSELTNIVRNYIEEELKVPALENTSSEVINLLKDFHYTDAIKTDKETIEKLNNLLKEADLVKFAKSKPLANEIEKDRSIAEDIINNLKTKPVIKDEEVTE